MRKLLLFSALLPLVLACGKENNHTIVIPTPSEKAPTSISLSSASLTPAQAEESFTLTITSPAKPEMSPPPEWIGITLGAYKNYKMQVTVKVAANETYELLGLSLRYVWTLLMLISRCTEAKAGAAYSQGVGSEAALQPHE